MDLTRSPSTTEDLLPKIELSDHDRFELDQERIEKDNASPLEVMGAAVETEQLSSRVYKAGIDAFQGASWDTVMDDLGLKSHAPDVNFKGYADISEDDRKVIFGGLSMPEMDLFQDEFDDAVSLEHAKSIRKRIDEVKRTKSLMDAQGPIEGFSYAALANISDPPAVAISEATAGLAAPFVYANKASRLSRALRLSLVTGASSAVTEAFLAENDPYRQYSDVIGAGLFGGAFGFAGGYMSKNTASAAFDDISLQDVQRSSIQPQFDPTNPTPLNISQVAGDTLAAKIRSRTLPVDVSDDIGIVDMTGGDIEKALDKIGGSMGAARIATVDDLLTKGDEELLQVAEQLRMKPEDVKGDFLSETGYLARSENPIAGYMAAQLNLNPTSGLVQGKAQGITLVEDKDRLFKIENSGFVHTMRGALSEYAKASGQSGLFSKIKTAPSFFKEVGEATLRGIPSSNPAVNRMVSFIDQQNRRILAQAKEAGVEGLEEVSERLYMKRAWSADSLSKLEYQFGSDSVYRFIAKAMTSTDTELDPDKAITIAKGIVGTIKRADYGVDTGKSSLFSHDTEEQLRKIAKEVIGDEFDEDTLDYIVAEIRGKIPSTFSRAKRRTVLDDAYEGEIEVGQKNNPEWGTMKKVKMTDFFETNAMRLQTDYLREMSGVIALAKKGFNSPSKITDFLNAHKRIGGKLADDPNSPYTRERFDDEKVKMQALFRGIMGRPMFDANSIGGRMLEKASPYMRALKDWNYMRLMNGGGFNMGGEILSAMVQGGIKETAQQIPAFRNILSRAKSGELNNELAQEVEMFTGIGVEHTLFDPYNRLDDLGNMAKDATVMGRNITPALGFGTQVTSMISGMTPLTMFADRGLSMVFIQKLANKAAEFKSSGGKDINKWWGETRMESLGLSPEMRKRVYGQLTKHGKYSESWVTGRKIQATNMREWDDLEAAEALSFATYRFVNRAVQKNSLGDMRLIFSNELASLATQFMGYGLSSMNKQLSYGLKMRDWAAGAGFAASTIGASLFYTARVHVMSLGRDDREEYLERRLNDKALTAGAIYYSTYAGVLPNIIDTGLAMSGNEEFFSNARSSNMVANVIIGNPSVDLITDLLRTTKGITTLPKDIYSGDPALTQQDWNAFKSILPYQNFAPINAGANAIRGYLPSRYEE